MALLAIVAKAASMHVVLFMAAVTVGWKAGLVGDRSLVTCVASQVQMAAIQLEIGPLVMVEVP
jgi:hypothetical protein